MKFTDIIALAKQGFTPADIREFLKLETEPETAPAAADPETDPTPAAADPETDPAPAAADPETGPAPAAADPEPDYKKLYEEEKAKRQAAARKQEVATDETKSVEDTLLDIAKMYI